MINREKDSGKVCPGQADMLEKFSKTSILSHWVLKTTRFHKISR
jgi:hypothetical protein